MASQPGGTFVTLYYKKDDAEAKQGKSQDNRRLSARVQTSYHTTCVLPYNMRPTIKRMFPPYNVSLLIPTHPTIKHVFLPYTMCPTIQHVSYHTM